VDKGNEVSRAAGGLSAKMREAGWWKEGRKEGKGRIEGNGESASGRERSAPLG